jgi:hypothetical protein
MGLWFAIFLPEKMVRLDLSGLFPVFSTPDITVFHYPGMFFRHPASGASDS